MREGDQGADEWCSGHGGLRRITAPTGAGGRGTRRARRAQRLSPRGAARRLQQRACGRGSGERERGRCAVAARPRRTAASRPGRPSAAAAPATSAAKHDDGGQRAGRHGPCPAAGADRPEPSWQRSRCACRAGARPAAGRGARAGQHPRCGAAAPWRRARATATGRAVACPPGTTNSAASTASAPSRAAGRLRPRSVRGWEVTGWSPSVDGLPSYRPAGPGPTGRAVSGGTRGRRRDPGRGRSAPG